MAMRLESSELVARTLDLSPKVVQILDEHRDAVAKLVRLTEKKLRDAGVNREASGDLLRDPRRSPSESDTR